MKLPQKKKVSPIFKLVKRTIKAFYSKYEIIGTENLPDNEAILVGNHSQMHGPVSTALYFEGNRFTWCTGEMMHFKEVPAYAFSDFWSRKPRWTHPFFKLLSYIIAPFAPYLFKNANAIAVYHDNRIMSTFRNTVSHLENGDKIIIFPEHYVSHNNIVCEFQDKFIDVAKLYHKRTNKELSFVPMYIAPKLHKIYLGKPIEFCSENPVNEERKRICNYLMDGITEIARALPEHTVIPYPNISKKYYLKNTDINSKINL